MYLHPPSLVALILPRVLTADRVTTLVLVNFDAVILMAVLRFVYCASVDHASDAMLVHVAKSCLSLRQVIVEQSRLASVQKLFATFPSIKVHNRADNVYSYNLQSLYERDD